ncbi:hypothetical protein BD414DRAFT_492810 [Trametes punicea]|nr:hypothetical protein BD414DRAFT_492810 [Trametes punicea]
MSDSSQDVVEKVSAPRGPDGKDRLADSVGTSSTAGVDDQHTDGSPGESSIDENPTEIGGCKTAITEAAADASGHALPLSGSGSFHSNITKRTVLCDDIIVDNVLAQLDIEDIARLRQVSQQFLACSAEAAVWKRRFERAKHFLPPVPPTARYSFEKLSAVEAERLLVRCSSLSKQWDTEEPRYLNEWQFDAYRRVIDMVLLPGGQYIVASVTDRAWKRFAVQIFTADFRYSMASPIAQMSVPTKAFELRAKYMTFRGKPGIVVTYIRRDYRHSCFRDRFDINRLPVDLQPAANDRRLKYECVVAHVPLEAVELLGDVTAPQDRREFKILAKQQGRPFHILTEIKSRARLSNPAIDDDIDGTPLIAVLKHTDAIADRILYKNLDGGPGTTLLCTPNPNLPDMPHSIMTFCIIPIQKQFLVIRRAGNNIDRDEEPADAAGDPPQDQLAPYYWAEFWDIVNEAGRAPITREPAARSRIYVSEGNYWLKVWLSDHGLGPALAHDRSLRPQLLGPGGRPKLKPITAFVKAKDCGGIAYSSLFPAGHPLALWPLEDPPPEPNAYRYVFTEGFLQFNPEEMGDNDGLLEEEAVGLLPGTARPLLYTTPPTSRPDHFDILRLTEIWDRALVNALDIDVASRLVEAVTQDEEQDGAPSIDAEKLAEVRDVEMGRASLKGISAIAWDDTIGRLCVAYTRNTRIAVFDFAAAPLRV